MTEAIDVAPNPVVLRRPQLPYQRRVVYFQRGHADGGLTVCIPKWAARRAVFEKGMAVRIDVDLQGRVILERASPTRIGRPYSVDEDLQLRDLHAEGLTAADIARRIGRPVQGVLDRLHKLDGLSLLQDAPPKRRWSPLPRVHADLNMTRLKLLRQRNGGAWSDEEVNDLRWLVAHDYGSRTLTWVLRRPIADIRAKALELGLLEEPVSLQEEFEGELAKLLRR